MRTWKLLVVESGRRKITKENSKLIHYHKEKNKCLVYSSPHRQYQIGSALEEQKCEAAGGKPKFQY